jgi:hypothetical protein
MPLATRTNKRDVLIRFRDLLKKTDGNRFENRTFIRVHGEVVPENQRDREFLTVQPTGGPFDYAALAASGQFVVPYQGTFRVLLWKMDRKDRTGSDSALLLDGDGMFDTEHKILKQMTGSYLPDPDDENGVDDCLLTQALYPISDSDVARDADEVMDDHHSGSNCRAVLSIDFGVDFHWDLTS